MLACATGPTLAWTGLLLQRLLNPNNEATNIMLYAFHMLPCPARQRQANNAYGSGFEVVHFAGVDEDHRHDPDRAAVNYRVIFIHQDNRPDRVTMVSPKAALKLARRLSSGGFLIHSY